MKLRQQAETSSEPTETRCVFEFASLPFRPQMLTCLVPPIASDGVQQQTSGVTGETSKPRVSFRPPQATGAKVEAPK